MVLVAAGCAAPTRQTDSLLAAPGDLPRAARVREVPFIKQTDNYCGPATLTMAMEAAGKKVTVEEIAAQVYTPGKSGTLQQDLIGSARRQGMLAVQIQGMPALLREVSAGNPVIVFMNLGLSWYPIYHYAIVTGYDLNDPLVVMHSGKSKNKEWSMRKFERSWMLGKYWGLVVLPATQLSATADEMEHSAAGAGLESAGKLVEAESVYENILGKWPQSFGALLGMGNLRYAKNDVRGALVFLRRAVAAHPNNSAAWHNLTIAQGEAGENKAALQSAKRAWELAAPEMKPSYEMSLKEWLPSAVSGP